MLWNRHKEEKGEACREVRGAQEGLLLAKAMLVLQGSITKTSLSTTPKGFIHQHSALPVDLRANISMDLATSITFRFMSNFYGLEFIRISEVLEK